MKSLAFDAGPVISLTLNNLLWILEPLEDQFLGEFVITERVRSELVDYSLTTKKFKFGALQVQRLVDCGIINVVPDNKVKEQTIHLLNLANTTFSARGVPLQIVHYGEMSAVAALKLKGSEALVIDERTSRELIERPEHLGKYIQRKLHSKVSVSRKNLQLVKKELKGVKVIRSTELAAIAFELGLLDRYIERCSVEEKGGLRKMLIEGVLWALKLQGCSISEKEIAQLVKAEIKS